MNKNVVKLEDILKVAFGSENPDDDILVDDNGTFFRILPDLSGENPRELDECRPTNLCILKGDFQIDSNDGIDAIAAHFNCEPTIPSIIDAMNNRPDEYVALPIYIMEHSLTGISTSSYGDEWDSWLGGIAYVAKADCEKSGTPWNPEKLREWLEDDIKEFDAYLQGELYSIETLEPDRSHSDCLNEYYEGRYENPTEMLKDMIKGIGVNVQSEYHRAKKKVKVRLIELK